MNFSLAGRTALVTGGARGCGLALAQGLAEAGADVAILDLIDPPPAFHKIGPSHPVRVEYFKVDVSSLQSLKAGFAQLRECFDGAIDICVACAGINKNVAFLDTSEEQFDSLMSVNVKGVYYTAQLAAKAMISSKTAHGSIILVSSIAASRAIKGQMSSVYCGTKGALQAMCPPVAAELAEYGIRVNSLSPGYVQTEMTAPFPHLLEDWRGETMNGIVSKPDHLQGAGIFLASDASKYMTAQDVCVDGASLIHHLPRSSPLCN